MVAFFPSSTNDLPTTAASPAKWLCQNPSEMIATSGASGLLFFRQKSPAARRRNSQYAEKIDRSARSVDRFGFALGHQTKCERIERGDAFECFVVLVDLREFRVRQQMRR